jgi:hypothetical protein
VHADSSTSSPSSAWLIGATFGGYFTLVYVLRFWGEGFLLPASDVVQLTPEPKSHILEIGLAVVGLVVTLLGVLQSIYSVQVSEKLTRISLWLNFFAILGFCVYALAENTSCLIGPCLSFSFPSSRRSPSA